MAAQDRVIVKTTVPPDQKQEWTQHAETLDMSQSEFVRSMIQAGRHGFELEPLETPSEDANPRGNVLREPVLDALSTDDHRAFDEIVESVVDDVETGVDETLQSLLAEGQVEVSGRNGGYRLTGEADGDD